MIKPDSAQQVEKELLKPAFSLVRSLSDIVGIQMKFCAGDGNLHAQFQPPPMAGPCAVLFSEQAFAQTCAASHAAAIHIARSLRRPYIFTCHARLAAWAIPLVCEDTTLPAAIICGGALLIEPDPVLAGHLEAVALEHNVNPAVMTRSLDDLPVVPREYLRAVAAFTFDMTHAVIFPKQLNETPAAEPAAQPAFSFIERPNERTQMSLVFPPQRRKTAKKEKARLSAQTQQKNIEEEVVRLLRERRRDEARRALLGLIRGDFHVAAPGSSRPDAAETFTRLFRNLSGRRNAPDLHEQQAALLKDALGLKRGPDAMKNLVRLCERFVSLADEMVGGPRPQKLKSIQKYLEKNLARKLTLTSVGRKYGVSEKPLNELFLRNCGVSFTDYVISLRVSEAKRLLETTDLTLGEIARKTGFSDQSYFTKVFKATAGITPSEYRKK